MEKISAIVLIGGNPEKSLLKRCLDSLSWVFEIIKIDTDSTPGDFSAWRNLGAKRAKGDWLLYIDSDEIVTSRLAEEIRRVIGSEKFSAYAIPRRNFIFGKEFRHCGTWPDYVLRLIRKNKLIGWFGKLHEQPRVKGEIGYLKEPLTHIKHKTLSAMVEKTNKWSEIEAKLMFEAHHPKMNFFRFASAAAREFWLRMIMQLAFLDGIKGIIYAIYQIFSRLISYSKLWEMQLRKE